MSAVQILLFVALLRAGSSMAGDALRSAARARQLSEKPTEEVLVTADHAGPALWKVTSGQHLLWILAEPPTPLPTKMIWRTKQVEAAIASAQELILDGGISFNSLMSATPLSVATYQDMRMIPGKQTSLRDVVPEDLYRRFEALKGVFAAN